MPDHLPDGTVIASRFKVLQLAGRGGSGLLYKAFQPEIERVVAVKVLQNFSVASQSNKDRFEREAKLLSRLVNENFAYFVAYGYMDDGAPYLITEWIDGQNLRKISQTNSEIFGNVDFILSLGMQICEAMDYAHQQGVVHRDLKPENVMLSKNSLETESLKIVDFGASIEASMVNHQSQRITKTGEVIGTLRYMSPEQCMGKQADQRSDIYSLSCILFELFTGAPPHAINDPAAHLLQKTANTVKFSAAQINDDRKSALAAVLKKGLAIDPSSRYQTMQDFSRDIGFVQRNELRKLDAEPLKKPIKQLAIKLIGAITVLTLIGLSLVWSAVSDGKKPVPELLEILKATSDENKIDRISKIIIDQKLPQDSPEESMNNGKRAKLYQEILSQMEKTSPSAGRLAMLGFVQSVKAIDLRPSPTTGATTLTQSELETLDKFSRTLLEKRQMLSPKVAEDATQILIQKTITGQLAAEGIALTKYLIYCDEQQDRRANRSNIEFYPHVVESLLKAQEYEYLNKHILPLSRRVQTNPEKFLSGSILVRMSASEKLDTKLLKSLLKTGVTKMCESNHTRWGSIWWKAACTAINLHEYPLVPKILEFTQSDTKNSATALFLLAKMNISQGNNEESFSLAKRCLNAAKVESKILNFKIKDLTIGPVEQERIAIMGSLMMQMDYYSKLGKYSDMKNLANEFRHDFSTRIDSETYKWCSELIEGYLQKFPAPKKF